MRVFIISILLALLLGVTIAQSHPDKDIIKKQKRDNRTEKVLMEEGKTYFLEVESAVNGVLLFSLVDTLKNPHKTIIAAYYYDWAEGTTFEIVNPFSQRLRFAGYAKVSERGSYTRFESQFVVDVYKKQWPFRTVEGIIISGLELVE